MQRCIEWTHRYATGAPGGLGFGAELWADVSAHPAAARLQALARTHQWNFDAGDVRYRITRPLLLDVIHAACGIEYTVERLLAAIDEVQRWLDDTWQELEPAEISVSAERWDVSFEVSNLVVWARTLVERLETKTRVGGVDMKIGLLPALADSDRKDQVQRFHDELAGWVEAEGYLAGFALHIGRPHGGTPSFRREPDGQVRFLLPDRPGTGFGRGRSSPIATIGTQEPSRSTCYGGWSVSWMGCSPAWSSMCQSGSGGSGTPDARMLARILRLQRLPVTCATCGLHSASALVVRDHLE